MPLTLEQFQKEFYEEAADWVLGHYTPEQRMKGLTDEERMQGISAEKLLEGISAEKILEGISDEVILQSIPEEKLRAHLLALKSKKTPDPQS